ncbi:hypothetical protein CCP4SC76_5650002 [Gammaproteobacteria bacterium]
MARPLLEAVMKPVTPSTGPVQTHGRTIERVLLRHTVDTSPEVRLCVAIVRQAVADLHNLSEDLKDRESAQSFVQGPGLDYLAPLVGLEPGFVREMIDRTDPPEVPKRPVTASEDTAMSHTPPSSIGEPMIDAKQAANATRLPRYWFSNPRMRARFRIPHYLIVGMVRYRVSDLDIWLRTRYIPHQYLNDPANGPTGGHP